MAMTEDVLASGDISYTVHCTLYNVNPSKFILFTNTIFVFFPASNMCYALQK
jgi:hypothetical protein